MTLDEWLPAMRAACDALETWRAQQTDITGKVKIQRNSIGNLLVCEDDEVSLGYINVYFGAWHPYPTEEEEKV